MGFLDKLATRWLDRDTKGIGTTELPLEQAIRSQCEISRPQIGNPYSDQNATKMYTSWVYTASTYNAKTIADCDVCLYSSIKPKISDYVEEDGQIEIIRHPILDLMNNPNESDSLYSFLYKTQLFLELTGDAYILINKTDRGIPISMDVLYSQYINIQTDGLNRVIAYNYGVPKDGKYQYSFLPDQICHLKFFNPNDVLYGISPLEACARSYGMIVAMDTFEEALNRNMGVPSGIVKYKNQTIKDKDRELVESKWQNKFAGVGRGGKVLVTDADMDFLSVGISPREMVFLEGRKWSREDILSCYGIPHALIVTESVNRANMTESSIQYHYNTVEPRLKMLSQQITSQLIRKNGIDGKNLRVEFYREAPINHEEVNKRAEILTNNKAMTVNELREMLGMDLIEDEYGNKIVGTEIIENDIIITAGE